MVVAWIVVVVVVVFWLLGHKKEYVIHKKLLTPSQCQRIIDVSNKYKFDDHENEPEPVDGKPAWEIDIYSDGVVFNPELWNLCQDLKTRFKKDFLTLDYIFLRRYRPEERQRMFMHFDDCQHAVNVLLSNPSDIDGGELYIFDRKRSRDMGDRKLDQMPEEIIDAYIAGHPNLPIVPYEQGDAIEYSGNKHLHGTLPVTKGTRYMLAFFYK